MWGESKFGEMTRSLHALMETEQGAVKGRPASAPVIRVDDLHMSYGPFAAVRGISFEVRSGEILAFLGPNGAGKTTTLEILEGFRRRTSGSVSVLGEDPGTAGAEWRARIGVVLQESEPESELTVRECLSLYAGYYPKPRAVDETLELVGLRDKRDVRCGRLSGGLRRRLDVGLALIGDPALVFLDEPTTGFDPSARRNAWEVVANLRTLGKTILLTTHYMDEAEYLADWIVVVAGGRIVAEGTSATLGGRDSALTVIRFALAPGTQLDQLPRGIGSQVSALPGNRVEVRSSEPLQSLGRLSAWAASEQLELSDLEVGRPRLEDIYLELTKGST